MFKNMSIKSRLMLLTCFVSSVLIGLSGLGIFGISQSNQSFETVYKERAVALGDLAVVLDRMQRIRMNGLISSSSKNIEVAKQRQALNDQLDVDIANAWKTYSSTNQVLEETPLSEAFHQQWKSYEDARVITMNYAISGNFDAATENAQKNAGPKFEAAHATLFKLLDLQRTVAAKEFKESQINFEKISLIMIIFSSISIILVIIVMYYLSRAIVTPLNEAISVANAVALGDLTSRIETNSTNETGRLLQALSTMNDNLADLVGKVRIGTDSITTSSGEIASGNLDLSQRTEEQASSLEETASAMEELTSTVKQNAESALQANQLAIGASEVAVKGGAVVGQVVQTMSSINESSKKIVDIISVIDGIAFQTNILALNAAVEAARAGEQGRGFAVVATEVRTLAQRSAAAAKEIKGLISDSVSKVEDGTRLVDQAGATMNEIVSAVKRVTDIMSEISAASQEQSSGIEQVNQAVTQMDQVTQQNAALVEEAAAAAESMQEQAQTLTQAVAIFKLSGSGEPTTTPAKRSNRPTTVAQLPSRVSATKKKARNLSLYSSTVSTKPNKAAAGGSDWDEF